MALDERYRVDICDELLERELIRGRHVVMSAHRCVLFGLVAPTVREVVLTGPVRDVPIAVRWSDRARARAFVEPLLHAAIHPHGDVTIRITAAGSAPLMVRLPTIARTGTASAQRVNYDWAAGPD